MRDSPLHIRTVALALATGATIFGGVFAYKAVSNELSGTAVFRERSRNATEERVTRELSGVKFREATNLLWGWSAAGLAVGVASFALYWKLGALR